MKKSNFGFSLIILMLFLFLGCKKDTLDTPQPAAAQVAPLDTEFQTSINVSYANFLASDIEMACSAIGEGNFVGDFFVNSSTPTSGTCTIIRDNLNNSVSIAFNQTICRDGRLRDGSIFMYYKEAAYVQYPLSGNENFVRDFNYTGRVSLKDYKVDGWLISNSSASTFIKNLRPDASVPLTGNLKWSFIGEFKMKKNLDSMTWKGNFTKTLENTANPLVFNPNSQSAINWRLAIVSYTGMAIGTTYNNVPYIFSLDQTQALSRDFSCTLGSTIPSTLILPPTEFHPFITGLASFTTGVAAPRTIYYNNTNLANPVQCDDVAFVKINNVTYQIILRR